VYLVSSPAFGQATRTWVSGIGDDANPCTRTAPCKTFAGAIGKTSAGGEIDVLGPGGFGALTITKSITVEAHGLVARVTASGANGILVDAPGAVVVLRGLTIEGTGDSSGTAGLSGIVFLAGSALYIESSGISGFSQAGINIAPNSGQSKVFITHTVVRNSAFDGILVNPSSSAAVSVTLNDVNTHDNGTAGVEAEGLFGAQATVNFKTSTSTRNNCGILSQGTGATINLNNATVVNNITGLSSQHFGKIVSIGNNRVAANVTDGTPTSTVSQP
jgi:hypothetical protein